MNIGHGADFGVDRTDGEIKHVFTPELKTVVVFPPHSALACSMHVIVDAVAQKIPQFVRQRDQLFPCESPP